ncbi:MAG: accessory Sec system translocase SecA2, partial [Thermoanaerobaculia bacterium]|nr:accessory Sec system translocase SecA2 [Thermoanaerobaculia bacterium]
TVYLWPDADEPGRAHMERVAALLRGLAAGRVVEMPTGEGKTPTAVAPVALAARAGGGVHVLTFNDYLARRDAAWMGPVYEALGLTVGVVQEGMTAARRRRAYARDVTYLTAREAGFDYLRDGLALSRDQQVFPTPRVALVDECDSILIDEARVPLVIAGAHQRRAAGVARLAELARRLRPGRDFELDEHRRNVFLTEAGVDRVEAELGGASLVDADGAALAARVRNALHAEHLLRRDVDYIVRGGAVELVDEFTGRVAERRQWPDGLQAAVEAKEGLRLGAGGTILGSITLQHFLRLYPRLAGMTATVADAADELDEVYGLEPAILPPHRPSARVDLPDRIYAARAARDRALLDEIAATHGAGRPVLVGTASVAESERLAAALTARGIGCRVLNARNDEAEAAVVARAGASGAVTISTNMAGRGTDIRLGEGVADLGGLCVLGTHRHESRRIDLQLRGRAGRQGDPGSSRFFLSLDDDLLERFGIRDLLPRRFVPEGERAELDSPAVRREVERVQRIAEGEAWRIRRRLFATSRILESQRLFLRGWRERLLRGDPELEELLQARCPERRDELARRLGEEERTRVERRLALAAMDRCCGEYLTEMEILRDEVHLVALDGREPLAEFYRGAIQAFETLLERIEETIVDRYGSLRLGPGGVEWEAADLGAPAATWTYLVHDEVFSSNLMLSLSTRASIGLWGVITLWWLLIPWGLYLRWRRRQQRGRESRAS